MSKRSAPGAAAPRQAFLDYAKALSIFYVVFIHVGFSALNKAALFAMPLFFAATGYSFSPDKRSFRESVRLRFRSVLLPFWKYMALYTLVEMLRAPLLGYGSWRVVFPSLVNGLYGSGMLPFEGPLTAALKDLMSYKAQTDLGVDLILPSNCHLWFLPAMFCAYVFFAAAAKRTLRSSLWKAAALLFLFLLATVEVVFPGLCQLPYGIGRGALGAIFMLLGFWAKACGLFEGRSVRFSLLSCLPAAAVYLAALHFGSDGSLFVRSYYGPHGLWSLLLTAVGGAGGTLLVFQLCRGIEALPFGRFKGLLAFAGQNVLTLYALHMAVKTLFDLFYVKLLFPHAEGLLDEYQMGLLPERALFYMLFEAAAVIALCLLFAKGRARRGRNGV